MLNYTTLQSSVAGADYVAVVNQLLEFSVGDTRICYTVTINQDELCENNPNENFFVNLEYESGILPITVSPHRANVVVDDDGEVECGEFDQIHNPQSVAPSANYV